MRLQQVREEKTCSQASMRDVVRDSFGSLDRMINIGATSDMADALLSHNSQLASRINRSLQEVGDDEALSKPVRILNGLNMATRPVLP